MSGSGYAVMSAAPQLLATAALAPYGFCQMLFAQINRFVPAHLFSGLYRPKLIAEYAKTGSFEALNQKLITILKISNYILALSLAVFFGLWRHPHGLAFRRKIRGCPWFDAAVRAPDADRQLSPGPHGPLQHDRARGFPKTRFAGHAFGRAARFPLRLGGSRRLWSRPLARSAGNHLRCRDHLPDQEVGA